MSEIGGSEILYEDDSRVEQLRGEITREIVDAGEFQLGVVSPIVNDTIDKLIAAGVIIPDTLLLSHELAQNAEQPAPEEAS